MFVLPYPDPVIIHPFGAGIKDYSTGQPDELKKVADQCPEHWSAAFFYGQSKPMKYGWVGHNGKTQHILKVDGTSWCKRENSEYAIPLDQIQEGPNAILPICKTCRQHLRKYEDHNFRERRRQKHAKKRKPTKPKKAPPSHKDAFLASREWAVLRYQALVRSNGCCEACGRSKQDGAVMQVDHILSRRDHPDLALSLDNLQILCAACNWGKGNTSKDWREPRLSVILGERIAE